MRIERVVGNACGDSASEQSGSIAAGTWSDDRGVDILLRRVHTVSITRFHTVWRVCAAMHWESSGLGGRWVRLSLRAMSSYLLEDASHSPYRQVPLEVGNGDARPDARIGSCQ